MFRTILLFACAFLVHLLTASPAAAQTGELSSCKVSQSEGDRFEREPDITRVFGSRDLSVRIDCDDMQFFADFVELFNKTDIVAARGHVVFVSQGNRISADRMEFNTRTRTGTFYNAYGTALLGDQVDRSLFGTQEPYAFFWGEELEKLGPTKYRITRGGFTTCVQPTPRWEIASGSMTVNLNDYALLTNSVFRVKGVPVMYLPIFYYPIQEDDRATGFLLPTYGTSTLRGQSLSNAFFWAISRSQDATFFHDWFSKTGQGYGSEYRYIAAPGSQGTARVSLLNERALEAAENNGIPREAARSYTVQGDMVQGLGSRLNARGSVYYFSSIRTQQQLQQNVLDATNSNRRLSGGITGTWGPHVLNVVADKNDFISLQPGAAGAPPVEFVNTYGSLPRVTFGRSERAIGTSPVYFGFSSEYVTLVRSLEQDGESVRDQGLSRFDVMPTVRVPFNRWSFLTLNSAASWRGTYWTESLDPTQLQVGEGLARRYFDFNTRITGPVFTRIFDNPGGGYAERFKHVIEPGVTIQRITAIDEFNRIVRLEPQTDDVVGDLTRVVYGITNRLYAKKDVAREIASVSVAQTYLTNANAAQFERGFVSGFRTRRPTKFLPVAVHARATPTARLQAEFRTDYDVTVDAFTNFTANGTFAHSDWLNTTVGWSQVRFIDGFNTEPEATNYLTSQVNVRGRRNTIGGTYSFHYDLRNDRFLQQRWIAYYNAQCCGIGVEYQTFDLRNAFIVGGIPQDRRFNLSFSLAGIGSFSNLFGAFGGQGR
jgi:LPS-assembly protein